MCTSKGLPIIFVNNNHSNDKKRFTIAHELGHLVMHLRNIQRVYSQDNKELDIEAVGVSADLRAYSGQQKREVREVIARSKDFLFAKLKPEPRIAPERILMKREL